MGGWGCCPGLGPKEKRFREREPSASCADCGLDFLMSACVAAVAGAVVISPQTWARSFMRVAPRIVLNNPHLPRPPLRLSRHFLFWRSPSEEPTRSIVMDGCG